MIEIGYEENVVAVSESRKTDQDRKNKKKVIYMSQKTQKYFLHSLLQKYATKTAPGAVPVKPETLVRFTLNHVKHPFVQSILGL